MILLLGLFVSSIIATSAMANSQEGFGISLLAQELEAPIVIENQKFSITTLDYLYVKNQPGLIAPVFFLPSYMTNYPGNTKTLAQRRLLIFTYSNPGA